MQEVPGRSTGLYHEAVPVPGQQFVQHTDERPRKNKASKERRKNSRHAMDEDEEEGQLRVVGSEEMATLTHMYTTVRCSV